MKKIKDYLKLMRIKHYIKNLLIFLPLIFSMSFYSIENDIKILIGFILFSLTCSIVYIINDIADVEKDRKHPKKCNRPIASGRVSKKEAYILAIVLFIVVVTGNICINANIGSVLVLLGYFLLNIIYSKKLKNIPLLDIACLVSCFVLRVFYGATLINVEVSNWLYLTIMSFSCYLALGKRRNELQKIDNKSNTREVLKYYNKNFLDKNMYMCLALAIGFYSMWCVDTYNIERFGNQLMFTVPIFLLICMKYSLNIEGDSFGDPVEVLLSDKVLVALVLLFVIFVGFIVLI